MLLTLTTTHSPATDLGHLLRKNPANAHTFELSFGNAHVYYPEASPERCMAALLVEVDPVRLVRKRAGAAGEARRLEEYVNDRPYAASSFLSVAIAQVFGSALAGQSKERPELAARPIPLAATLPVLPCRGGEEFVAKLFAPLGYRVTSARLPLDARHADWGESPYCRVTLEGTVTLQRLLSHLYVLVPVLDNDKHYWVGDDEVKKLLRRGAGWLAEHPEREAITLRYLKYQRGLVSDALAQLADESDPDPDATARAQAEEEATVERTLSLNEQRLGTVLAALKASAARSVLDLGCGEGRLLRMLLKERQFTRITGVDVSQIALERAARTLRYERMPPLQKERIRLLHGSLLYRDARLAGYDAAAVVEVVEHLDSARLAAFERVLFEFARPRSVVLTTPNREFNATWPSLPAGKFRHRDHRFEWTRSEFREWAAGVASRRGYAVRFLAVGLEDPELGPPTQMGVFTNTAPAPGAGAQEEARGISEDLTA
ncbi:MAG: 3' terminal RNA ribose 2'-O-methyltransferase Hen1 [Planctomycetes bacterium]|nr:3' terminal RNA ribose 2'-O-methyltransferase Hen1 [Planctomycetota bacterium]